MKNNVVRKIVVLLVFAALAGIFHFSTDRIADPDAFYHLAHARIYAQNGIFSSEFPWTQFSSIKTYAADLWYGFHIILIPFSGLGSMGIKISGAVLTFITFVCLWLLFKKQGVVWPVAWVMLIFVSSPNIMYRFLMLRPHLLSMILALAVFLFSVSASFWILFAVAFLMAWIHLSLVWVGFLALGAAFLFKLIFEKKWLIKESCVLIAGSLLGWLARPNPLGALRLAYIQVVELMQVKQGSALLLFGSELFPLSKENLLTNFGGFFIIWIAAIVFFFALYKNYFASESAGTKSVLFSTLVLSAAFFVVTMTNARRAHDFWVIFGVLLIAVVSSVIFKKNSRGQAKYYYAFLTIPVFIFLIFHTTYKNSVTLKERGETLDKFKTAAEWLKENSNSGDIVFNTHWSDFPMLFFWNSKNYYIGGMDPIFQYDYDKSLYWKFHYISNDQVTSKTCPASACTVDMLEDTYGVMKNDFRAKYIFIEKARNVAFYTYLETSTNLYEKKVSTPTEAVYLVK